MEPVLSKELLTSPNYVYQVKWDGVRILAKVDQGNVILHTRHGNIRTQIYPEISEILADQFAQETIYLDGEMISLRGGKPDFFQVVKRDRLKTPSKIETAIQRIPVSYILFDILYYKEDWLTAKPLIDRLSLLEELVCSTEQIQLCPTTNDGEAIYEYTKNNGWEGIVIKEKMGGYHIGEKNPTWRKVKHTQTLEAAILGVTLKSGIVYSLLLGIEEVESWRYIGRVSSGLSVKEKQVLTEYSRLLTISHPVTVIPSFLEEEIRWFSPNMKAVIRFLEWTPDGILRNPVLESFLKS
jgi:bifunctional non-homologous end joining protein LigD